MDDDRRRKSRGKCHRRKNRGAVVLCCLPFRDSMELSLINIRILDEYLHSDEFSLGRARTLWDISKAWNRLEKYERRNDAIRIHV